MSRESQKSKATDTQRRPATPSIIARKPSEADPSRAKTLRQRAGNRGAQALASRLIARSTDPGVASSSQATAGQLSISQAGDAQEREADRMADIVMRMPAPASTSSNYAPLTSASAAAVVQRMCAECEDESKGPAVQRKEAATATPQVTPEVTASISALQGGGSPMPASTRNFFEPRFGADFSQVRVHADSRSADTAKAINAKAFTVGRDIAFSAGQYAPESHEGQRLLAHELTHVMQEDGGGTSTLAGRVIARQPDPAPTPDPEAELTDDLANHLLQESGVIDALELSKGTVRQLTRTAEKIKIDDEDLKQRLAALDKKKRGKIVAAAMAQVQSVLAQRRAERLNELADEIAKRTKDRFEELAEVAQEAELEEEKELAANPKRKGKRRPQFGVIRKYILKDTVERQIDKPQVKPYALRADYATPLGLAKDEVLFPELHDEDFVAALKTLPKSMRQALKNEVGKRTIEALPEYIQERMGTVPQAILDEWKALAGPVRDLIEGKINGYFAVRMELLKLFGSPTDVPATIQAINDYFTNELVKCDFLLASGVKMTGPGNTLVHKTLNAALMKAEEFIKDPKRKWLDEVVTSVSPLGYWATNIRENRNNPARPSEHTYGFAVDINADLNPNLAKFKPADWDFISAMVGDRVIYEQGGTKFTEGAKAFRDPSASTEDKMLAAMKKIHSQSGALVATFASDSSLRARLRDIVSASPAGKGKTQAQIDALLDLARDATTGLAKDRQKAATSLQATLEADIFKQQPIASEWVGTPSKLREKLVKLLAPNLRQLGKVTDAEPVIRGQIMSPVDQATADAKKHKVGALFTKSIVKELNAVPTTVDRAELARQVLRDLREPLIRKSTDADARALAGLLKRGFEVLDQTTDKTGAKVGTGAGMANIAVHGFSNLNEKLVVALVHPEGGNLRWLGVHNQDMHHFELRTLPPIPKATITAPVPQPAAPPPAVAPQSPGLIDPWPEL